MKKIQPVNAGLSNRQTLPETVYDMHHDAPYLEPRFAGHLQGLICRVLRSKVNAAAFTDEALYRELAVQRRDDDAPVPGGLSPVHNEDIAGINARPRHGIAGDTDEKRGCGMPHEELIQIKSPVHIVIGRRRETGRYPGHKQRKSRWIASTGMMYGGNGAVTGRPNLFSDSHKRLRYLGMVRARRTAMSRAKAS